MGFLTEWLTNIILLILLATILELMLPNSNMQRYVKMVVGLLLLVMILQPLLSIFTKDVDEWLFSLSNQVDNEKNSVEESINLQKRDIELGQLAYISEQVAVQLERQVEETLREEYSLEVARIDVEVSETTEAPVEMEDLKTIYVEVTEVKEDESEEEMQEQVRPVSTVRIDTSSPLKTKETEQTIELKPVQQFLSESWQIPTDTISLAWEGGKRAE
ncbi:stage III sporulation protein AF [Halalkalibacter urbisdiaboli]|uniref:stage III sporulation protein AF n=1 Tax=Halalkalibacter urbisdiaboli TaxID=1960589 RepID=UPI000B449A16|nr:stage III sporulation protein AF [Halalkalibacter urbisdiaboli]